MKSLVASVLFNALKDEVKKEEILSLIEIPPTNDMGDYAFPCFFLAKIEKKNPMLIAQELKEKLILPKEISNTEAKAGYLNFFIDKKFFADVVLKRILKEKEKYGAGKIGQKIMVEFSQPNTHKAFHVGHIRGTSLGESLSRIFGFLGDKVIRANYSGDTGMHIAKWIWCYQKFHKKEKLRDDESWIAGIYVDAVKRLAKNEKLQEEVDEINRKLDSKEDKALNELWKKTRILSINSWKKIYKELGTKFDVQYFESEVEQEGKRIALELLEKKIAKKDEGAVIMDLKEYNLGVWVLLRKDGTVLYSAKDLALAEKKLSKYSADKYLALIGDEQKLHFQQLIKTLELMHFKKKDSYNFLTFNMVRLPSGKMSSRTGDNVLYSEFIDELKAHAKAEIKKRDAKLSSKKLEERALKIAIAAIKYSMLKQDSNKVIIFDKEEALNFEGNTGPYLLYSYARANSILKKVKANKKAKDIILDLKESEIKLIKELYAFPEKLLQAYKNLNPAEIANYAFSLAQAFNEFYHACPVLGSVEEKFRLNLIQAFIIVMKISLNLLGIEEIKEM
jgi:arginyl-tRNA synthetase